MVAKRSCGGCDGTTTVSYTATVLNAAKSLGKGLLELGEQMAAGFGGGGSAAAAAAAAAANGGGLNNGGGGGGGSVPGFEDAQPGLVTIVDIKVR